MMDFKIKLFPVSPVEDSQSEKCLRIHAKSAEMWYPGIYKANV